MTLLSVIILAMLLVNLIIALFNALTAPLVKNGPKPAGFPLVSILIPARNEEQNIATCLGALQKQTYPSLQITVLDDQSRDQTSEIVRDFSASDKRIRLISGRPLPPGWTGKNWACHQLSEQSDGEILLFTDADNWTAPDAVSKTVGWMQRLDLALFSCFPQQITCTLGEKLVVPLFDLFVYTFLPLRLTYKSAFSSLAAANGQWIAFNRKAYRAIGGHSRLRNRVVEDVEFSRLAKRLGMKIITASGRDAVYGRMYHSWSQVWQGFSKNAFGLMGFQTAPFIAFLFLLFAMYVAPYIGLILDPANPFFIAAVALNVLIRLIAAIKFKQPFFTSVLLHPIAVLATLAIGVHSLIRHRKGGIEWKGRSVILQ
ncbi:glycosyltransferase [candidate division KSB1 bacterium]|nr:glycosyltransferase [candidate division KSB1 bacterium]